MGDKNDLQDKLTAVQTDANRLAGLLRRLVKIASDHHEYGIILQMARNGFSDRCPVCSPGTIYFDVDAALKAHDSITG